MMKNGEVLKGKRGKYAAPSNPDFVLPKRVVTPKKQEPANIDHNVTTG
jgi:hypothetical protein